MSKEPEPPTVGERKSDAVRRLQVGGTGLILVALLVGLSTLLTSEARDGADSAGASAVAGDAANVSGTTAPAEDPLTDLGVEPAAAGQTNPAPATPKIETRAPVGPIVPDLQPDPQLNGAPLRR